MPQPVDRVRQLGTETALDVLVKARALEEQGRRVIHLEVGEPDFATPEHIVEAGVRALRAGSTRYGPPPGLPELREAIAAHTTESRGARVSPDQVVVGPGAKPLIFHGLLATVAAGDEVLIPDPGFPIYESMVRFCGGVAVPVPARLEEDRAVDVDALEGSITPRTRLIIFNSPSNPSGAMVPAADLRRLAKIAQRHDLWVMADEIYHRIVYEPEPGSIGALPGMLERTIIIDGFSKAYAMTGWRLGWGVFPPSLVAHAVRLVINSHTCTAAFVQAAGVAALTGPQDAVAGMVEEFRRRREAITSALARIPGVRCRHPAGAFYAFPDVSALPVTPSELADRLLHEEGVAVLDGAGFGPGGAGHLRFSFASSLANLEEAGDRFARLVARITG